MSKVENKIKAVIFAGGYGTRITEETQNLPRFETIQFSGT
jgi:hypothetical protein